MKVRIRLTEDMLGTAPKDPEVYARYIQSKGIEEYVKSGNAPNDLEHEAETIDTRNDGDDRQGWTAFRRDDNGLFLFDYMVKGFIKEAANTLKDHPSFAVKALRSKVSQCVFVTPRRIYIGTDQPDGVLERPLKAQTMQGPRVSLARSDTISAGREIEFNIAALPHKDVKNWRTTIIKLLQFGAWTGLGQWRSGSYGRFEIVSIDGKAWEPTDETRLDVLEEMAEAA